jgi:hypothetical protein
MPAPNVKDIAAGAHHGIALKKDGSVVCWGGTDRHLPSGVEGYDDPLEVPKNLGNVIQVAAGMQLFFALNSDGKIISWGRSGRGEMSISNVTKIAAGTGANLVALKADGTAEVFSTSLERYEQNKKLKTYTNIRDIGFDGSHVSIVTDVPQYGTVLVFGKIYDVTTAEKWVDVEKYSPKNLTGIKRVETARHHSMFLDDSGKLTAFGFYDRGSNESASNIPESIQGSIIDFTTGESFNAAIIGNYLVETKVTPDGSGQVLGTKKVFPGGEVTLEAVPNPGFLFSKWQHVLESNVNPIIITPTGSTLITAVFTPDSTDPDEDGLSNHQELTVYNTNPYKSDSDGDGINDSEEIQLNLDPNRNDSTLVNYFKKHGSRFGLYTEESIKDLSVGRLLIKKTGAKAQVQFTVESSVNLDDWNELEVIEWSHDLTPDKQFIRIQVGGGN